MSDVNDLCYAFKSTCIIGKTPIFTRHFYNKDEVCAALSDSLLRRTIKEAIFWSLELIDSEMYDELLEVIFKVYIGHCVSNMAWLNEFIRETEAFTIQGALYLCINMCRFMSPQPPYISKNDMDLCRPRGPAYFKKNWRHGQHTLEWFLTTAQDWFDIFEPRIEVARYMTCLFEYDVQDISEYYKRDIHIYVPELPLWILRTGRRARRQFSIPMYCRRINSSIDELNQLTVKNLKGCPYYDGLIENMGDAGPNSILDIEYRIFEMTHSQIFPDDIPDEWSAADKAKSHGCTQPA